MLTRRPPRRERGSRDRAPSRDSLTPRAPERSREPRSQRRTSGRGNEDMIRAAADAPLGGGSRTMTPTARCAQQFFGVVRLFSRPENPIGSASPGSASAPAARGPRQRPPRDGGGIRFRPAIASRPGDATSSARVVSGSWRTQMASLRLRAGRWLRRAGPVDLVEHETRGISSRESSAKASRLSRLFGLGGIGRVDDVQQKVGIRRLFEGGAKAANSLWQLTDETYGVGDDDLALSGKRKRRERVRAWQELSSASTSESVSVLRRVPCRRWCSDMATTGLRGPAACGARAFAWPSLHCASRCVTRSLARRRPISSFVSPGPRPPIPPVRRERASSSDRDAAASIQRASST